MALATGAERTSDEMKKLTMLMVAAFAVAVPLAADTEKVGDYTWTYRIEGDAAEIYKADKVNTYTYQATTAISPLPTGAVTIPSTLGGKPVTRIGERAFEGCSGMTSVTIPASVTFIGSMAFTGCSGLNAVHIADLAAWCRIAFGYWWDASFSMDDSNPLFFARNLYLDDVLVTNLTIPVGVTRIEIGAFYGCSCLTRVTIGNDVTDVGSYAFSGCGGLTNVVIGSSVTSIGVQAFSGCSGLTGITIPNGVSFLGEGMLYGCSSLETLSTPFVPEDYGLRTFFTYACSIDGLSSTREGNVPASLKSVAVTGPHDIPARAFAGCSGLTSVTMPRRFEGTLGASVFEGCPDDLSVSYVDHTWLDVEFDANGGSVEETSRTVAEGAELGTLPVPQRADFSFAGWYTAATGGKPVTAATRIWHAVTFYAQWQTNRYTVAFDANGGTGGVTNEQDYASEIVAPAVEREGYMFLGWSPEVDATVPASNVTYTAQWRINQYTLTFDANGGTGGGAVTADYGTSITAPAVTRQNYTLAGWTPAFSGTVPAADTTYLAQWRCDWNLSTNADDTLTIVGINFTPSGVLDIPAAIDGRAVTGIEGGLFAGFDALDSVGLPTTLTDWGLDSLPPAMQARMTYDADGLMVHQGWLLAFRNKDATTLAVPEGIVGIGRGALAERYDLETVTLPQSLKHIAEGAFRAETYLDNLVIPDGVETIGLRAFEDCSYLQTLTLGKGVKSVGARAFAGCTQLSGVVFADGLAEIGAAAFDGCWRMQSVSLPLSAANVASSAFTGCTSLTGVTTPTHGGKMSEWFAPVCSQVLDVTVPEGETEVRDEMFKGCSKLRSVALPEGVTNVAASAFEDCGALGGVTLPESLVAIGDAAFGNCGNLAAIVLPEKVTRVGTAAFQGCGSLSEVTLSRGLAALPDRVFEGCGALDSLVVPESVANLGSRFVSRATTAVYYLGDAPTCAVDAYGDASDELVSYVILGTKGWDGRPASRDIPQSWNGRGITMWTANRFDVTFDANGGKFVPGDAATYACEEITDTGYSLPPFEPVRAGYRFDGYWTEPSAGTRITTSVRVKLTKAHVLYAHWLKGAAVTVRFNANGGAVLPGEGEYVAEAPYGDLPVPTREHYAFEGWFTQAAGGTRVLVSSAVPKASHELFAHWSPCRYTILFHANDGTDATEEQPFAYGDTVVLRENTFSLASCEFAGWALAPGGAAVYADGKALTDVSAVQDNVIHLYAVWRGDTYAVRFDSHGGVGRMDSQTFVIGVEQPLAACAYVREGYTFAGWATSTTSAAIYRDGAAAKNLTTARNATVVLYAVWVVTDGGGDGWTACDVTFDAQGGDVDMAARTITSGAELETLPNPVKEGYAFEGWFTAAAGGTKITSKTVVVNKVVYYAHWSDNGGGQGGGKTPAATHGLYGNMGGTVSSLAASEYDGYLVDAEGNLAGTIQVKVGKPNANTGLAAVKATVIGPDGKKKNLRAADRGKALLAGDGPVEVVLAGGEPCTVTLGAYGMTGTYGNCSIDGGLNVFASKDAADKVVAAAALGAWQGAVNVAWKGDAARPEAAPYQTLTVSIAAKGRAKASVTLADGTKASASSQLIVGEDWCCVPVLEPKKSHLAFTLWLPRSPSATDGTSVVPVDGQDARSPGVVGLADAVVGKPGTLKNGAAFRLGAALGDATYAMYLPDGVPVAGGARWTLPRAGKVAYRRGTTDVDEAKLLDNPSALKLTYTARSGTFKGSFKTYAAANGRPKATTVNVTGVLVNGVGYGAATVRKPALAVPVTIE